MLERCEDCEGSGKDLDKTRKMAAQDALFRHRVKHHGSYIRCWACSGNGWTGAQLFQKEA